MKGKWSLRLINSGKIIIEQDYQPELGSLDLVLASVNITSAAGIATTDPLPPQRSAMNEEQRWAEINKGKAFL